MTARLGRTPAAVCGRLRHLARKRHPINAQAATEWRAADMIEAQAADNAMLSSMLDRAHDEREQLEREVARLNRRAA